MFTPFHGLRNRGGGAGGCSPPVFAKFLQNLPFLPQILTFLCLQPPHVPVSHRTFKFTPPFLPLTDHINNLVNNGHWPIEHGSANIIPAHKKMSATNKGSYRPISVLLPVSNIFERLLCIELSLFMKDKFLPLLCGFRKNYNTQHTFIHLIEQFKHCLDNSRVIAAVLIWTSTRHMIVYPMTF